MAPGLDPLGDHDEAQIVGEADDVGADGLRPLVAELADQGAVDLDRAQMQPVQVAEAGVAGAEIVQRDRDAEPAQLVELVVDARVVVEQHVLGELELEQRRRDVGRLRSGSASRLAMPPWRSCEGERLTATRGGAMPPARQRPIWPSASARTQAPRGSISPVSSASGRKAAGRAVPRCGCCQRSSASRPVTVPSAAATLGW